MMTANTGGSSSVTGHFDPIKELPDYIKNTWAFKFEHNTNAVNLNVNISAVSMVVDSTQQSFKSELGIEDVDHLIQWLIAVKMQMQMQKAKRK